MSAESQIQEEFLTRAFENKIGLCVDKLISASRPSSNVVSFTTANDLNAASSSACSSLTFSITSACATFNSSYVFLILCQPTEVFLAQLRYSCNAFSIAITAQFASTDVSSAQQSPFKTTSGFLIYIFKSNVQVSAIFCIYKIGFSVYSYTCSWRYDSTGLPVQRILTTQCQSLDNGD